MDDFDAVVGLVAGIAIGLVLWGVAVTVLVALVW